MHKLSLTGGCLCVVRRLQLPLRVQMTRPAESSSTFLFFTDELSDKCSSGVAQERGCIGGIRTQGTEPAPFQLACYCVIRCGGLASILLHACSLHRQTPSREERYWGPI